MFLDEIITNSGTSGLYGKIFNSRELVSINNTFYDRSIAVKSTSEVVFNLDGTFNSFQSNIALNDTCDKNISINFSIYADGKLIYNVSNMFKQNVHYINININGAKVLKLCTESSNPGDAVWINPQIFPNNIPIIEDPLQIISCKLPSKLFNSDKCIFTIITPDYLDYAENMFKSLLKLGQYDKTTFVAFCFDSNNIVVKRLKSYNVRTIPCESKCQLNGTSLKTIMYRITDIVRASKYMYIDADMLVLDDLSPLFETLDSLQSNSFLAVKHSDRNDLYRFEDSIISGNYEGKVEDISFLGLTEIERNCTSVINSGFFVTNDSTMLALGSAIELMLPNIKTWMMDSSKSFVREEAVLIAALAKTQACVLLGESYNLQLHDDNVLRNISIRDNRVYYKNKLGKILHFTGDSKNKLYKYYLDYLGLL